MDQLKTASGSKQVMAELPCRLKGLGNKVLGSLEERYIKHRELKVSSPMASCDVHRKAKEAGWPEENMGQMRWKGWQGPVQLCTIFRLHPKWKRRPLQNFQQTSEGHGCTPQKDDFLKNHQGPSPFFTCGGVHTVTTHCDKCDQAAVVTFPLL